MRIYRPYHESAHVLNILSNVLVGGTCLDRLEPVCNNGAEVVEEL